MNILIPLVDYFYLLLSYNLVSKAISITKISY